MRHFRPLIAAASIALAACATAPAAPFGPETLRGCWIERGEIVVTQRWLPPAHGGPDVLVGETLEYHRNGVRGGGRWGLRPAGDRWELCELDSVVGGPVPCWTVGEGAQVTAGAERLEIALTAPLSPPRVLFAGVRDGCD